MVERVRTSFFRFYLLFALYTPCRRLGSIASWAYLCGEYVEAIPNTAPLLKPTTLGDIAKYFLFSAGGLFLVVKGGLLTGGTSAHWTIKRDLDSRAWIEVAFRKFRADALRKRADALKKKQIALTVVRIVACLDPDSG